MKRQQLLTIITALCLLGSGCSQDRDQSFHAVAASHQQQPAHSQVSINSNGVRIHSADTSGRADISIGSKGVHVDALASHGGGSHVSVGADGVTIKTNESHAAQPRLAGPQGPQFGVAGRRIAQTSEDEQTILVLGAGEDRDIDGTGKNIVISGAANDVVISGHCLAVVVSGASNDVLIERADKIVVSGANNDVVYKQGSPKVLTTGVNSSVVKG